MIEMYHEDYFAEYGTVLGAKTGFVLAAAYPITMGLIFLVGGLATAENPSLPGLLDLLIGLLKLCVGFLSVFVPYLIFIGIPAMCIGAAGGQVIGLILFRTRRYLSRPYAIAVGLTTGFAAVVIVYLLGWLLLAFGEPLWEYFVGISFILGIPGVIAIVAAGWGGKKLYDAVA